MILPKVVCSEVFPRVLDFSFPEKLDIDHVQGVNTRDIKLTASIHPERPEDSFAAVPRGLAFVETPLNPEGDYWRRNDRAHAHQSSDPQNTRFGHEEPFISTFMDRIVPSGSANLWMSGRRFRRELWALEGPRGLNRNYDSQSYLWPVSR
jgi:hypothetical protein